MPDKIDLVMWTKNGAKSLPFVLKRLEKVTPREIIANKIMVDDNSSDNTTSIGEQFGWQVVPNKGSGISDGANTALEMVTTPLFASFEQDILLSADWWLKVPQLLEQPSIAVASGIRIPSYPPVIRKIEEYTSETYLRKNMKEATIDVKTYGMTLDNTIYKTNIVRQLGGFPKLPVYAGIDTILDHRLEGIKLRWVVDLAVRSVHLRESLKEELKHYRSYAGCVDVISQIQTGQPYPLKNLYKRLIFGPARGFQIALKMRAPQIIYVYPLIRMEYIRGIVASRKFRA